MTAGLFIAGLLITALVVAGIYFMDQAGTEPAARAVGEAPDPEEEREVRGRPDQHTRSILKQRPPG